MRLNILKSLIERIAVGNEFHWRGPAIDSDRSLNCNRDLGTSSLLSDAERKHDRPGMSV